MLKPTKLPKPRAIVKKTARNKPAMPTRDLFTLACWSHLKVGIQKEYRFHKTRMWRFDYAIPEHRIAIEVEGGVWTGGRHTQPQGFITDMEKYNTAATQGWRLLRVTPKTLVTLATFTMIREAIAAMDPVKETE